ncbi:MAG: tetratricopeptide repeat protein [Bryobacteraceae bacterium]|nr:tetratricopeptide repeat protein [Bryobacteraceae bacterium]
MATTDDRIAAYSKTVAEDPKNLRSHLALALEYIQKTRETGDGQYLELAAQSLDRALTADPDLPDALRVRNEIRLMRHEFRKVAEDARYLTQVNSSDTGSWGNLGDALMELGDYEGAEKAYRQMLSLGPNLTSYNRYAYYLFVAGKPEEAFVAMRMAIDSGSRNPQQLAWCRSELGDMYFKTGQIELARSMFQSATEGFPKLHRAHAGLAHLASCEGRVKEAIASYRRAQAIVPLPEYSAALEDLARETGDPREAEKQSKLLGAVLTLASASGEDANRTIALIWANRKVRLEEALRLVQAEFANRDDVYSYDALGWVLHRLGRNGEASTAAKKAIRMATPEPSFWFHAGMIFYAAGLADEARTALTRCVELNRNFDRRQGALAVDTLRKLKI